MLALGLGAALSAQGQISGTVTGSENGQSLPVPGAHVFWEGTETGTVTDEKGFYSLEKPSGSTFLVVHALGYQTMKKSVLARKGTLNFTLEQESSQLEEVTVHGEAKATTVDLKSPGLSYNLDDKELRKAACCNLSESFETNASVDVSFTDAVTGTRQIEMLGLAGKYALIQRENIPYARGLNANAGLQFIPGPFVESLQLTKGLASVVNGYESLTGQINVEFVKPKPKTDLLLNGYVNQGGRLEGNLILSQPISKKVETSLLAHYSEIPWAQDMNKDGFADIPVGRQLNLMNRWRYTLGTDWHGQIGITWVDERRESGQLPDVHNSESGHTAGHEPWIYRSDNRRAEVFGKNGYAPAGKDYSLGFVYSLSRQETQAVLGQRDLSANQNSLYLNLIYQDELGSKKHELRTGLSYQLDEVTEALTGPLISGGSLSPDRLESVPGIFAEYSFEPNPRLTLVSGLRADAHNLFGWFLTPRLHLRYMPSDRSTWRIGGGRGQRTASPITENLNGLASNRVFVLADPAMRRETGWNAGASYTLNFSMAGRAGSWTTDVYYTWFEQKLIADFDYRPQEFWLYYRPGSQSTSVLTQLDWQVLPKLDARLAYKFLYSTEAFYRGDDLAFRVPQHRAFLNLSREFGKGWKADLTGNWFGPARMPGTESNPEVYRREALSPDFFTVHTQINKSWKSGWEAYVGVENLFNYRQENPIVAADNTGSAYFDTNQVYGPIFGRMVYAGFYYRLPAN